MSDKSDRLSDKRMKDYRITVRFPADLRRRLKWAARSHGTCESELVRGAVERQLAAEEHGITAYERAKKAGHGPCVEPLRSIRGPFADLLAGTHRGGVPIAVIPAGSPYAGARRRADCTCSLIAG